MASDSEGYPNSSHTSWRSLQACLLPPGHTIPVYVFGEGHPQLLILTRTG